MKLNAMRDVGALVRSTRRNQGLTQAELAALVGVGREWVVRLERGSPRVEAQKVLDVLSALDLVLNVSPSNKSDARPPLVTTNKAPGVAQPGRAAQDPFDALFAQNGR